MQEVYNAAWYAAQEMTAWPFVNEPQSDTGNLLPDSIISDIKLITRGNLQVHITGVQVTESFLSVVLSCEEGLLAACTVSQPVKPYKHYKLETFKDNTVGTIVFGHGAKTELGTWQFTENYQLEPSAVVSLPGFPVLSIGKGSKLSGDITLEAGSDLIIEQTPIVLGKTVSDGNINNPDEKTGIGYKLSLSTEAALRATTVETQQELLKEYSGPCSMRLTNKDCPYIISINSVTPDEYGNINIKTDSNDTTLTSVTVADYGDYSYSAEYICKDSPYESVFVLLGDKEEMDNTYVEGTFRRCGTDLCETTENTDTLTMFSNAAVLNDGVTSGVALNNITGLLEPITGIKGQASVKFSTNQSAHAEAIFRYYYYAAAGIPVCGIIYNIEEQNGLETYDCFKYSSNVLTLGNKTVSAIIDYGTNIKMTLSYSSGVFTGKLYKMKDSGEYEEVAELSHEGENTGEMGVYMENCRCQSWSENG